MDTLDFLHHSIAEELQCPICYGRYEDPRLLNCNHTFCRSCLERCVMPTGSPMRPARYVQCAVCRVNTPLKHEGVSGLRQDFRTNRLLGVIKEHEVSKDGGADVCETCPRETPGTPVSYCSTCQLIMCKDCVRVHGLLPPSKNHYIVDISRLTNGRGDIEWPEDSCEAPNGGAHDGAAVANRRRCSEINDWVEEFTSSPCTCTVL